MKVALAVLIVLSVFIPLSIQQNCAAFKKTYEDAMNIVSRRRAHENNLQAKGYVLKRGDLGFERSRDGLNCNTSNYWTTTPGKTIDILHTTARLFSERNPNAYPRFHRNAVCLKRYETQVKTRSKYRPLNGYGNNLKNPFWGTPNMPLTRQGPKNYDDGISSIRKSVTGSELPSPRKLLTDVFDKAWVSQRTTNNLTVFFILSNFYISHDQAHTSPTEAFNNCQEIRCCSSGNKNVLHSSVSHSACLPIAISKEDEFYGPANISCLNFVRSEPATSPTTIETGEILNRVTAFVDHSMIYGSGLSENNAIRSFVGGKIYLGRNNILPVDNTGKYTKISDRLTTVPIGAIIPVLLARNHNNLAEGLAAQNPSWGDERLFQEARRINIALFEQLFFHKHFFAATGSNMTGVYNAMTNAAPTVEFISAAYRFFHVFMNPTFSLVDRNNNVERIPMSETFKRIDLIENRFDDALRGSLHDRMNFDHFSDELYNKFAKDANGTGLDVISFDIQRCRDHGMPTYLEFRESAGLQSNFTEFDELVAILPRQHVDLLKDAYEDVRDIDLYVGGALESFANFSLDIVGETFGAIIGYQFTTLIEGDAYYYTHPDSPYPFTPAQIDAINSYDYQNLICVNSGLEEVPLNWANTPNNENPMVPCSNYRQIDLTLWQGI